MNCHRARQLISPYLDDQLTGRQMLALQQHFAECDSCEAERRSILQVKRLLRSLHQPQPPTQFPQAIAVQVEHRGTLSALCAELWIEIRGNWLPTPTRPQRGRRLATSLALSCLTVLAVAAPFAPASRDQVLSASGFFLPTGMSSEAPAQPGMTSLAAMTLPDARPAEALILTDSDEARRERLFAAQYAQPAPPALAAAPGGDDAVNSYVQGDVALAGYRTR